MLTEEEKKEIYEKEIFRLDIKKKLKDLNKRKKNFFQKILSFFNTSLGIFLLSTLFVSFGSWLYSQWSEKQKIDAESNKLGQEISYRLIIILDSNKKLDWDSYLDVKNSAFGFSGQPPFNREDLSAFPDLYQKVSIFTLAWQLNYNSRSKQNNEMYDAIQKFQSFIHKYSPKNPMNFKYEISNQDSLVFEKEIKEPLLRWKKNYDF